MDGSMIQAAWRLAAQAHQGQEYPGTALPYIVHVGAVCLELSLALAKEPEKDAEFALICAVLHDVVEDTEIGLESVETLFGTAVTAGVSALTKDKRKAEKAMVDSLRRIKREPQEVWMVKLADRIVNLGEPPAHWTRSRCLAYAAEGEKILKALGAASENLSERLAARIGDWRNRYAEVK